MSVRKREWTTAKGERRTAWVLDYKDRDGKRRLETFERKKDADARHAEVKTEIKTGTHVPRGASITIKEAGENWIQRGEMNKLERGTLAQYRQHLDKHIVPRIGHVKLSDITAPDVAAFETDMHKDGVSDAMRRKILVSLSSLLREAMRTGHVNRNVADGQRVQASKRARRKLRVGKDIPTAKEISTLIASLEGRWRAFFVTAAFTGMRASELRGLHWRNVDLEAGEIHVRERADTFNTMGAPKSEAGERTIPVGPFVVNTLKEWKLASGGADGLVFPTATGKVQSATNIRKRALIPAMEKAGIVSKDGTAKYTGLHALRHFYASWLINPRERGGQGLPPKVVQERLGHATLALTMDTYSHLFPRGDDAKQIAEAEQALIGLAG